jgi:ABC-2 type transport system permease protein
VVRGKSDTDTFFAVRRPAQGGFGVYLALARAGFRRYSTYRIATLAGATTNITFGFLRCYALLAVAAAVGGTVSGYDAPRLATYVWASQGMLAVIAIWDTYEQAGRIRTGDVVVDLQRPVDPVWHLLAVDVGRAAFQALSRFTLPLVAGALAFDLYAPRHPATYPLFAASMALAVVVSFGCRHLVQSVAYWILDVRGPQVFWALLSGALSGLYFPLWLLPEPWGTVLVYGTPIASMIQAPMDVLVERAEYPYLLLGVQAGWAAVVLAAARLVQRRAERRLVVQGG